MNFSLIASTFKGYVKIYLSFLEVARNKKMPGSGQKRNSAPPKVKLFTHVEIEMIDASGESEHLSFDLVPDEQADFYSGLLGEGTPLAKAILGQVAGSQVNLEAGETCTVKILTVNSIAKNVSSEGAARRKAVAEEALKQAERMNAMIFSTTVEGKWGEYDADGMMENWD
jgi:hypothetical protein